MLLSLLSVLFVICVVVFIHELGHYLVAIRSGVQVTEFSIGFGKELWSIIDRRGTRWKICRIPFGGYVKLFGDTDVYSSSCDVSEFGDTYKYTLQSKSVLTRMAVVSAGPIANLLLSIVIMTGLYWSQGYLSIPPIISEVIVDSPAFKVGLQAGDIIEKIDNKTISAFDEIQSVVMLRPNHNFMLTIERGGIEKSIAIRSGSRELRDDNGKVTTTLGYFGISPVDGEHVDCNFAQAIFRASYVVYDISGSVLVGLGQMISGKRSASELRGGVTVAKQTAESAHDGLISFMLHVAMLSINLGIINLLPVPMLDGGHLAFYLYELIIGKPMPQKNVLRFYAIGKIILAVMFIMSIFNDIKSFL